jgi:DNA-binding transcriptional MocR family regulator
MKANLAPPPPRDGHLYERLATRITSLIDQGTLRPGERVPSVRKVSLQQRVSIATAIQAYRVLENRGLIEARPQSGYYVRPRSWRSLAEPAKSAPPVRSAKVSTGSLVMRVLMSAKDPSRVPLSVALPCPRALPLTQLARTVAGVARRSPQLANSYDIAPGLEALRVQIARRMLDAGCALSPEDIVITCGCQEALSLSLRTLTRPGDTVAVESPTYFGVVKILETLGLKACEVPTYPREGVCLDELAERLDCCRIKACLFMLNFSNPLGSCMPDEKKARLVQLLASRNIPLIEDDIYGELSFGPHRPKTAKSFDAEGQVLLCNSFCKTLAPGYRVGWVIPGRYRERIEEVKYTSSVGTSILTQMTIADFLANGGYDHHLRRARRIYADQVQRMTEAVTKYFPAPTKVTRPAGGYVLWVELPAAVDSVQLFEDALPEGISIAPGPIFSATERFRNFIRLSCGVTWCDRVEDALIRLGRLIQRQLD